MPDQHPKNFNLDQIWFQNEIRKAKLRAGMKSLPPEKPRAKVV